MLIVLLTFLMLFTKVLCLAILW